MYLCSSIGEKRLTGPQRRHKIDGWGFQAQLDPFLGARERHSSDDPGSVPASTILNL